MTTTRAVTWTTAGLSLLALAACEPYPGVTADCFSTMAFLPDEPGEPCVFEPLPPVVFGASGETR